MIQTLLVRGMLVGLVAGVLAFAFAHTFGEPNVDRAIAFEDSMHEAEAQAAVAKGEPAPPPEMELVSRPIQASIGLFTGVVVYSAAFGGIFALVFAFAWGRVSNLSPRALAAIIAAIGYVAIVVVPQIKYPANPPSVGEPDTITYRTEIFFAMLLVSILAAAAATYLRAGLVRRLGGWNATLVGAAAFVVVVAIGMAILPHLNEVPESFPAVTLWQFRLASLGTQAILWVTLGLGFGWLTERSLAAR
jgi:hypothetical protein